jgi:hypothetical protein
MEIVTKSGSGKTESICANNAPFNTQPVQFDPSTMNWNSVESICGLMAVAAQNTPTTERITD